MTRSLSYSQVFALVYSVFLTDAVMAQSAVEQNSNIVGMTPAGYYRGIPAMQDNEPSCAINPILPRNIVCAWNGSGGSDDLIGDTWLRFSESIDGGRTFFNRYLNGSNLDPATSVGQQFGADPVMMCWPGGCGTVMLASTRAANGGSGGGIYIQMMADYNTETGFRKALNVNVDRIYRSTGSKFADKPHAIYILDEDNPGVVDVTMTVEKPSGGTETITRQWPKARIVVVFALFNPSKTDIEILSTYTDNYGGSWSNPKQVAQTSGRDQGVSLAAIDGTVLYGFRRFAEGNESDAMMGVVVTRNGTRVGKPFEIVPSLCAYDVPTLPNGTNNTAAAARTNDFPWVSQNGSNFVMVYSERRSDLGGGCLTDLSQPTDSRIMAVVGSKDGKRWSDPVEVARNDGHGFQFMPTVDCSLGVCQIAWWDSRRDSQRTREFLQNGSSSQQSALVAFENLPIFADFQYPTGNGNEVIQFKRTVDMFTKKFEISGNELVISSEEPTQASRYRLGLFQGELIEREVNPAHVKAYKTNTVPFAGDYNSLTSVKHRFVFDPDNPSIEPFWEENAGPNTLDAATDPLFWLSWTDGRNMRGQLYTSAIDGSPPYTRTPANTMLVKADENHAIAIDEEHETLAAESVEDSNVGAMTCDFIPAVPGGVYFPAVNNRTKDADIYGALIENRVNAWSLNPTKTLGNILRTYTIVAENEGPDPRTFRFEIVNQPTGYPANARASWDQLPFEPLDPAFNDPNSSEWIAPDFVETEDVGPNSSVSVALFLVSSDPVNPVGIRIFDDATGTLINTITVNGSVESGPLLEPDGDINNFELHNPVVYAPDQFNPDQFNPDQYNPDQFNPDLYNPDQFNPDQFNPDQFNPDQFNPDQFNPDQFNPDQFNPDQFNPDQFNPDQYNPDQFNTNLTDSDTLHNAEIPMPTPVYVDGVLVESVVRLDVNFGIENNGNTLTPYSVDFALADDEVLAMLANQEITSQLIAWQDKQVADVQFCQPALITENRIIAAVNNPDLTKLYIPSITDNRVGALTYFIAPDDILQNTLRFIGPRDKIQVLADALENDIISYVFASQAANTDSSVLDVGQEQVLRDRTPPRFNFLNNQTSVFEAEGPNGALLPSDWVFAEKADETITTSCSPALGSNIPLDVGGTPTTLSCSATSPSNNVTANLTLFISVIDTQAPTIVPGSIQPDSSAEANVTDGAMVNFSVPTATDVDGVDPFVNVSCLPSSGSTFPLSSPGPTTAVRCIATDASGNASAPAFFNITIEDTMAPLFDLSTVPGDIVVEATQSGGANASFIAPEAADFNGVDADVDVTCSSASSALYPFAAPGPITTVSCTAEDDSGNESAAVSFTVTVQDTTAPTIDPASVPADIVIDATQPSGAYVPFALPSASDSGDVDPSLTVTCDRASGSLFPFTSPGPTTTTVSCMAMDSSGNESDPETFDVTVRDTQAPTISAISIPSDIIEEAAQSNGTFVNFTLPVATDSGGVDTSVAVSCTRTPGSLFTFSAPGPTTTNVQCTATDDSGNTSAAASFNVTIRDTTAPAIDPNTVPADIVAETTQVDGATVTFGTPTAIDFNGVDPMVGVVCTRPSGSVFDYVAPGPTASTVICTATDDSLNSSSASFDVTVQDTSAPVIDGISPPVFDSPEPFSLEPGANTFRLEWGPFGVEDPDPDLTVVCNVGVLDLSLPLYTFVHEFPVGDTVVICSATDSNGNTASGTFTVTVLDQSFPVVTLIGDTEVTVNVGSGPYVDAGATATDNGLDISSVVSIDSTAVDTTTVGTYPVYISASDPSGNTTTLTRTVIVELAYPNWTGIIPTKTNQKIGSSNPLLWAWLDENYQPIDTSGDPQHLSIRNCNDPNDILVDMAGDPGSSGFRYKSDDYWQFNWDSEGSKGQTYCAFVTSELTGQTQFSPPIRLR